MWSQIQKAIEFDAVKREASLRRRDKPLAFYELHGQVSTEDREKVLQAMDTRIVATTAVARAGVTLGECVTVISSSIMKRLVVDDATMRPQMVRCVSPRKRNFRSEAAAVVLRTAVTTLACIMSFEPGAKIWIFKS